MLINHNEWIYIYISKHGKTNHVFIFLYFVGAERSSGSIFKKFVLGIEMVF